MEFIKGFFENIAHTILGLFIIYFFLKLFFRLLSRFISGTKIIRENTYYINFKPVEKDFIQCRVDIIRVDHNVLRLVAVMPDDTRLPFSINHNSYSSFYIFWNMLSLFTKNYFISKLGYAPIYELKTPKELEKVLRDQFNTFQHLINISRG